MKRRMIIFLLFQLVYSEIPLIWSPDEFDSLESSNQSKSGLAHLEEESIDFNACKGSENGDLFKTKLSSNCSKTRDEVLSLTKDNPKCKPYIPDCDLDMPEKYKEVQCYAASNFCFCVHVDTGRPFLPGVYQVYPQKPECPKKSEPARKGNCGSKKKNSLKRVLRNQYKRQYESLFKNGTAGLDQVLRWKYSLLDKNQSNIVESQEWSLFGKETLQYFIKRGEVTLSICLRRLLYYDCDMDKNKAISFNEFKECFKLETRKNRKNKNKSDSSKSSSKSKSPPAKVVS